MFQLTRLKRFFLVCNAFVFAIAFLYSVSHTLKFNYSGFSDMYPCHYSKLTPPENGTNELPSACKPYTPDKSACETINKHFRSPRDPIETQTCPTKQYQDICWFKNDTKLECSSKVCGGETVSLGRRDLKEGHITTWNPITPFNTDKVWSFVQATLKEGDTFCFMKCGSILQVLVFPPQLFLKKKDTKDKRKININVVVLDSVSRAHFYRMMNKSINAFKDLVYSEDIPATALDFEFFQSVGTNTFENIRTFFSGFFVGKDADGKKQVEQPNVGMDVMYGHFQKQGYQTIFQDDLCWYDSWGTLLNDIKISGTSSPTAERWAQYKEKAGKNNIDHFGNTYFSCQVLQQYGKTNPFGDPEKVCLNGRFYGSYFLRYVERFASGVRTTDNAAPFVSYLHINTGHSETSKRISNIDGELADFIYKMARDPLTWTIFFGDHGHRRTAFALSTTSGIYERYHPLSFMIVPNRVAEILGKNIMDALTINQNRLVTVLDFHRAIMSINDQNRRNSKNPDESGVFAEISPSRTCSDVPLMPLVKCQCIESEQKYDDNSPKIQWIAEFALGKLNNDIQNQYSEGAEGKKVNGYGNCRRYIGTSFRNIIHTKSGALTRFNLHVKANGLEQEEVFEVEVATEERRAVLKSFERISTYNIFEDCVDKSVNIKLCACDRNKTKNGYTNPTHVLTIQEMKSLAKTAMFGREPQIKTLHGDCLFQITRNYNDAVTIVVEVANACKKKTFKVEVTGDIHNIFLSRSLPMSNVVPPNTYTFIYVSTKQSVTHFKLEISISASIV
ncbi:uncharacterized protein LOC116287668 [Actinia tenebrosa]|uniref:Uncharacterized protein LOC116287668 n=1 Tax=Actinia tenebrosa TaxID=6105 RepID=A0A6P8H3Q6_ACTTE|nr:uncharacterized protein LOC116287668 [Actinia tenebrosa]